MEKRFKHCYLHIGTEKTGTTTLQNFLAQNRAALAKEGMLYTVSGGDVASQRGFEACAHARPWTTDLGIKLNIRNENELETYRLRFADDLKREFATHPACRTLLISCEHFHSRLRTAEEIARLRDFLSPWVETFHVVVYLRRQDRVAVSFYSTKVKSGDPAPVLFPAAPDGGVLYYFDYDAVCDNWASTFGDQAMIVRLFDKTHFVDGDLLADFSAACGINYADKVLPENANESLNKAGLDFLLELNRQLPRVVDNQFNPVQTQLAARVSDMCRGRFKAGSQASARAFYEHYRVGNERLRERFLPGHPAPLFEEDFSDYPEQDEAMLPNYVDAVDIAIRLWRHKIAPHARTKTFDELAGLHRELNRVKAQNAFLQGQLALKNGNKESAERLFRRTLQLNDQHAGAHVVMAKLAMAANDLVRAREHLEQARRYANGAMPEIARLLAKLNAMPEKPAAGKGAAPPDNVGRLSSKAACPAGKPRGLLMWKEWLAGGRRS